MTTLLITNPDVFDLNFDKPISEDFILGMYGDNGGDPDGNAWLPVSDIKPGDDTLTDWIAANGHGEFVEARYANDEAIARMGNLILEEDWQDSEDFDDIVDNLRNKAEENSDGWAHYGAYGVADSVWVFVPERKQEANRA